MKADFFYDLTHAQSYLNNSLIRDKKGNPVFVVGIQDNRKRRSEKRPLDVHVMYLGTRVTGVIPITSLNLKPVSLGMCNWYDDRSKKYLDAAMIYRLPSRQWKVGMTNRTVSIIPVRNDGGDSIWLRLETGSILQSWSLFDTIMGEYPSLYEAVARIKGTTYRSVAFSRRFAIKSKRLLCYKNEPDPVGQVRGGKTELFKGYEFLQEQLEEDIL